MARGADQALATLAAAYRRHGARARADELRRATLHYSCHRPRSCGCTSAGRIDAAFSVLIAR
jgi:hypothetical protein